RRIAQRGRSRARITAHAGERCATEVEVLGFLGIAARGGGDLVGGGLGRRGRGTRPGDQVRGGRRRSRGRGSRRRGCSRAGRRRRIDRVGLDFRGRRLAAGGKDGGEC